MKQASGNGSRGGNERGGNRRGAAPPPKGGTVLGLFVGLILGLVVALSVAWYLTRHTDNPFSSKAATPTAAPSKSEAPWDPAKPEPKPETKPGSAASAANSATPGADEKQRFDFYKILPGSEEARTQAPAKPPLTGPPSGPNAPAAGSVSSAAPPPGSPSADSANPAQVLAAAPATRDVYFLQAGAFQNSVDADNLKARLALIGVEANVIAGDGWQRVRIGPFNRLDQINRLRTTLTQNGIAASLVKVAQPVTQ